MTPAPPTRGLLAGACAVVGTGTCVALGILSSVVPQPLGLALGLASLPAAAVGLVGTWIVISAVLRRTSREEADALALGMGQVQVVLVSGLLARWGHHAVDAPFTDPPVVWVDKALAESLPAYAAYEQWRLSALIAAVRARGTARRWGRRLAFDLAVMTGFAYIAFLVRRRARRGAHDATP